MLFKKANKWLNEQAQKEGWSKAEKLKNRATSQGAITLFIDRVLSRATLVEVCKAHHIFLICFSLLFINIGL
jgi:translation elongation factor EF-Ts